MNRRMRVMLGIFCIAIALGWIFSTEINELEEKIQLKNRLQQHQTNPILIIDKINLTLPIYDDIETIHQEDGAASLNLGRVEHNKNFAVAGHRNIRFGKNFNRLDELEVGDLIKVKQNQQTFRFAVTDKMVVAPNKGDVLKHNNSTEITLVTCHPIGVSSHRLIIKGELLTNETKGGIYE